MYRYDEFDHAFVRERVVQFRDQVDRRLAGQLTEDEFRPLRLRNGLYLQLHAYMLRIAIPYGVLSPRQLRQLAMIGRKWDRGYGHFTTRTNLQYHWIKLVDVPDILDALADVEMHCIQTSGNSFRNVTADPFAGAAVLFHDIGLKIVKGPNGENGFRVFVGGGMGRTPYVGLEIRPFLEKRHLLSYIESILRVYNLYGRRDNLNKARIKILVNQLGMDKFREEVEADWAASPRKDEIDLPESELLRIQSYFAPPDLVPGPIVDEKVEQRRITDPAFANWLKNNVRSHRVPGYCIAVIALKQPGRTPGDATSEEMELVADLAERYSHNELRVNYTQNLVLPHVSRADLVAVYDALVRVGLAVGNNDLLGDMICCPGLDYCNLANARSIPIAKEIAKRFEDPKRQELIGPLRLNMSGCINACGHHHAGNIGILGVDKKGTELYQISLGGSPKDDAAIGTIIGPGFRAEAVPQAIDTIIETYLANRTGGEDFLATWRRIGPAPFKEALYGAV